MEWQISRIQHVKYIRNKRAHFRSEKTTFKTTSFQDKAFKENLDCVSHKLFIKTNRAKREAERPRQRKYARRQSTISLRLNSRFADRPGSAFECKAGSGSTLNSKFWRVRGSKWCRGGFIEQWSQILYHFDEEQDLDPHWSDKLDQDPFKVKSWIWIWIRIHKADPQPCKLKVLF